jgi:ABC-type phosphate transport system substrate-binding protein
MKLLALVLVSGQSRAVDGVAVIAHPNVTKIDAVTIEKVFTGRVILVGGVAVTAVNVAPGSPLRNRFLQTFVRRDEDSYTGYWLVSRYSGLGAPPKELRDNAEVIKFIQSTPGAIGYIDEAEVKPGMNVLFR